MNLDYSLTATKHVLEMAGVFNPNRLSVISWNDYYNLSARKYGGQVEKSRFLRWGFLFLNRWRNRFKTQIVVQTYPDIRSKDWNDPRFSKLRRTITRIAKENHLDVLDHNSFGVDWNPYRTAWHVNSEGHQQLAQIIKPVLKREIETFRKNHRP